MERGSSKETRKPLGALQTGLIRSYKRSLDVIAAETLIAVLDEPGLEGQLRIRLHSETDPNQQITPPLSEEIDRQINALIEHEDKIFWLHLKGSVDRKNEKNESRTLLDKATSLLDTSDPFKLNINKLTFVAKAQKEIGINNNRMVDVLYQTMETFLSKIPSDADPDDDEYKLERVEAIMTMEDTITALIEIEYFDQAKRLLEEYSIRTQGFDDERWIKEFVVTSFVEIVKRESNGALSQDDIESLNNEQIQELASTNDPQTLEALGYFELVKDVTISDFDDLAKLSLTIGRSKKHPDEELDILGNYFQKSDPISIARALTKTLTHLDNQKLKNKVKELLDISRDNPQAFRRLLKGLLEAKDSEGKKIATELFVSSQTPNHYKLYLAKKLCGLGLWDRQINFYFRNIQKDSANSGEVHTDTLKAIITQMHLTPSLSIYEVLEKTRQEKDNKSLNKIARLGAKIFSNSALTLESKIHIFSQWSQAHNENNLTEENLDKLTEALGTFAENEDELLHKLKLHKEDKKTQYLLKRLYSSRMLIEAPGAVSELLSRGVFPTERLIASLSQNSTTIDEITNLKELTESGKFDPLNRLQKELEFLDFMKLNDKVPNNPDEIFDGLQFYNQQEIERELSLREQVEAEAAALEAANIYWLVRERVESGRKVTVVGNQRYGDYFVMEPLRTELQELGVTLSSFKIGSSGSHPANLPDIFPSYFIEYLAEEKPDVIIIDGTARFKENNVPRLPASFYGYLNWFELYNQQATGEASDQETAEEILAKIKSANPQMSYKIAHWSPQESDEIIIGQTKIKRQSPDYRSPNVIFANPVIDADTFSNYPEYLKEHTPAFLDDPERHIGSKKKIALTSYGVKSVVEGSIGEMQFANSIQNHMIKKLPRFIRETDPVFKD